MCDIWQTLIERDNNSFFVYMSWFLYSKWLASCAHGLEIYFFLFFFEIGSALPFSRGFYSTGPVTSVRLHFCNETKLNVLGTSQYGRHLVCLSLGCSNIGNFSTPPPQPLLQAPYHVRDICINISQPARLPPKQNVSFKTWRRSIYDYSLATSNLPSQICHYKRNIFHNFH